MSEELHQHSHDFSPRLINWGAWSIAAGALALILRRKEFMYPWEERLQGFILSNLIEGQSILIAPRWSYLTIYLTFLLILTGIVSLYNHPWKTLPQILIALMSIAALPLILALWNVYFFGPSLLFSVIVCTLGAWVTSWLIKDVPGVPVPFSRSTEDSEDHTENI